MKSPYSLIVILLISSLYANAEVTLDGTLGRSGALPGPDYLIGADLGRQMGSNLFHSFRDFNLNSHESATFSGPNSVTNLLSRVTGGNPSNIDGLIRSTIPNANMYFLNPHGIVFGPNARLDVQGSFHASTADYLHLKDGGRFEARQPSHSILTVAPVEAFGFLNSPVAPISVQGHGEVTPDWEETTTGLTVPSGKTLSLIGGKIEIWRGTFFNRDTFDDEGNESTEIIPLPTLSAPHGRINLASIASQGEIFLGSDFVDASSLSQLADIHLTENSLLRTSGEGGGSIFIRGGQIFADNSTIEAITLGSQDGGVIDLRANTISLNGATINGNTIGTGNGTNIFLRATDFITVAGENDDLIPSAIYARSGHEELIDNNLGDGGQISLESQNISFQEGAGISVSTYGSGKGGDITLKASESISFSGEEMGGNGSFVAAATYSDRSDAGDAGNLSIGAQNISFAGGSFIYSQTQGAGKGGNVTLQTSEIIEFSGENSSGTETQINVITDSTQKNAGDAGTLLIEADQIFFKKGAGIFNSTFGKGNAGTITLHANNRLELTGVSHEGAASRVEVSADEGTGNAGDIIVRAKDVLLTDGAYLLSASFASGNAGNVQIHTTGTVKIAGADMQGWSSAIASDSNPKTEGIIGGEGGNVTIEANQLIVTDGGNISASSIAPKGSQSSRGGNVIMKVTGTVELSGVNPYGENEDGFGAGIYARSVGVEGNAGEGGNIVLQAGSLTIKDGAVIKSSTNNNAQGGDIEIQVHGTINITGDATKIPLQAPAEAQLAYLQDFSPTNYNQSTSGIYARTEGKNEQAGQGGNITLYAQTLILTDKGKISTGSSGGGQAGNIRIEVNQLQLDSSASIASESLMSNTYNEANLADRDNSILVLGEVVEVADVGDGTAGRYINTGKNLIRTSPVYSVADMNALYELPNQYSLAEGDVIEVRDAGSEGQSARFVYAYNGDYGLEEWMKIDESKATVSFDDIADVNEIQNEWYSPEEDTPYESGELISVIDAGDGKPATFLYAALLDPSDGWTQGRIVRINQFTVANMTELQGITERTAIQEGGVALVRNMDDGTSSHFIYQDNAWIKLGSVHTVADTAEMNALTLAKTGNIAQIANTGNRFIYSGQSWLPLNNTYHAKNLAERNNLSVQTGDLVKVVDAGGGKPESFLYVEGVWKRQIKGGDAGTITIISRDDTRLSNNSAITTQALSAGGGGISINADNLLYLTDSQITTSVEEGAGNGGDLTIKNPLFVVLDNGQIVAQAHEGRGGNIHITSDQFIASNDSLVSASSELGIDGEVKISSPETDMSGALLVLPANFVDASGQLKPPCATTRVAQNSFVVKRFAGSPPSPYDWQSNRLVLLQGEETPPRQAKTLPSLNTTAEQSAALKAAFLTSCRLDLSEPARFKTSATHRHRAMKESSVIPKQLF